MVFRCGRASKSRTAAYRTEDGAHERNRTFDLLLTKEVLYRLSYVSNDVMTDDYRAPAKAGIAVQWRRFGAGDGNRTRTISLEG